MLFGNSMNNINKNSIFAICLLIIIPKSFTLTANES